VDIEEIRTFLAIAELGGFTRAAERLHRSQPAISRRLVLLEQELGAPLFERVRGRARLTEPGRIFRPYAEAALATLKDGHEAVHAAIHHARGAVSLALVGTLADTHIVDVLRDFAQKFPDIDLVLRTGSSDEVTDSVRCGDATLGLRYFAGGGLDLVSRDVGAEAMLVVAAPTHRLADNREHAARDFAGERWVGFPARLHRGSFGHVLARQLAAARLDNAEITAIDSLTAQKRLVQAGFGIALIPESSVREELRLGMLAVVNAPVLRTAVPVTVVHRRNGYLSPAARSLLALMTREALRLDGVPSGNGQEDQQN